MTLFVAGNSVSGAPLLSYSFGQNDKKKVLILGGVHGDEIEGVYFCRFLLNSWFNNYDLDCLCHVIPEVNPDGVLNKQRKNLRGVDLNRNLPTSDWTADIDEPRYQPGPSPGSEPENQALIKEIETFNPHFIISMHSWKPLLNTNGHCEPFAQVVSELTGYEIHPSIGYPTPGCLGTYTGLERNMPTLTYELEKGMDVNKIKDIHLPAVLKGLKTWEGSI